MSPNINGNKNEQVSDIKEIKFSCMDSNIAVFYTHHMPPTHTIM